MAGYVRQSAADIVPTGVVRAAPINNELNALRDAFVANGGHRHDGTAAEGHPVPVIGDADLLNKIATDTANNRHGVFVEVGAAAVEQVRFQDGAIVPVTDNDVDLGTSALEFKDLHIDGTANIDSLVADTADINGGTVDSAVIGATTPAAATVTNLTVNTAATIASADINAGTIDGTVIGGAAALAITGTTVTATTGFVGGLTGAVTGNTTGTHTGAVVGNVTGNLTGNVTASTGTSTFNDVTINGGLNMDAGTAATITNLTSPTNSGDAATKGYVDTADALKLNLSGGTMSGAIAMGTNKITGLGTPTLSADATTKTYVDTADALKLNLAGGTMSGAIAMGTSKITGLGDPTSNQDAATKVYVDTSISNLVAAAPGALDTLDELAAALGDDANFATTVTNSIATKLALAGGTMSGAIAMGTNKITGVGNPTLAQDAATKTYVDTADALKLNLSGGTMSGAIAMGTSQITGLGNPTLAQDAATKTYVDTADALKLNLAGGTMSGAIAMGTSKITGMGDPTANQDAATKVYVDTADALKLSLTGGTMSGAIAMGTSKITGLGDPTTNQDAATKVYVDGILGSSTAAAASASAAATSASNAATSASNASTSASNASSSASAASTSATNAAASYDSFDDRYLGSKASAPSVDNDGNTLLVGALYWNSTSNELYLWTGSAWTQAALTAGSFATLTGTETLTNKTLTSPILTTPALGTPASGVVTNLTGTASININGTVGATTASTGAFTTLSATGVATFSAGTAALPAITTTGDTNTGIFFPAADTMAFVEGGAEALRITSAGNVSIGNPTTTEAKLKIATTNGASDFSASGINICGAAEITSGQVLPISFTPIGSDSSRARAAIGCITGTNWGFGNLGFYTRAAADGTLLTTADERMRITSAGDVGIGTTSPSVKLEVAGAGKFTAGNVQVAPSTATNNATFIATNTGGSFFAGLDSSTGSSFGVGNYSAVVYNGANTPLVFFTNATEKMRLDASGNLGIGTVNPTQRLHVVSASGGTTARFKNTGSGNFIDFYDNADTREGYIGTTDGTNWSIHNDKNGYIAFDTNNTERARIDSSGNFGIGTIGPQKRIHSVAAGTGLNEVLRVGNSQTIAAGVGVKIGFQPNNDFVSNGVLGASISAVNTSGSAGNDIALVFGTGSGGSESERARIDSSGNFGIGTSSPQAKLQVNGSSATADVILDGNGSNNGGNLYFYADISGGGNKFRSSVSGINISGSGSGLTFGTSNNGNTAPTERMRIDQNGNLGVGTTSPATRFHSQAAAEGEVARIGSGSVAFSLGVGHTGNGTGYINLFPISSPSTSPTSLAFQMGGTERARIDSSGNFLIGRTTALAKLDVEGAIIARGILTTTDALKFGGNIATPTSTDATIYRPADNTLAFATASTERLRIASAGQLGIGGANYGTSGQVLTSGGSGAAPTWSTPAAGGSINVQTFTSSGTWTKPSLAAGSRVQIQVWGGGGSGAKNNDRAAGGGGGGYMERWVTLSSLGSTETITIGAGGSAVSASNTNGNTGGNTTVGSIATAYGGGGGQYVSGSGGGGGGEFGAGSANFGPNGGGGAQNGSDTVIRSVAGQGKTNATSSSRTPDAFSIYGGGGGGTYYNDGDNEVGTNGGRSVWGGGGGGAAGGGSVRGSAGTSINGGNGGVGGTTGVAGTQPAGGGGGSYSTGNSGAGANGQVIITVFPA